VNGGLGLLVAVSWGVVMGCDLPKPAMLTPISFSLPPQAFAFDASTWTNLPAAPPAAASCLTAEDCCTFPDCASAILVCETLTVAGQPPTPGGCSIQFPESLAVTVDLSQLPELQPYATKGPFMAPLTIDSVAYSVSGNTMNGLIGPVGVMVAPPGVTDPDDGRDKLVGYVPLVFPGDDPSGTVSVEGNRIFDAGWTTRTTFDLIASTIEVLAADLPTGQITLSFTISVSTAVE
jgi:hypothetical protein